MLLRPTALLAIVLFAAPAVFAQEEVTLEPSKDNTLFESDDGSLSNGAGIYLFAGTTQTGGIRRAVLTFDVGESIPDGAQVLSVTLDLNMSKTIAGARDVALHRLTADWGEGASDAAGEEGGGANAAGDDATWIHRFHDSALWSTAGGDFEATASATLSVGDVGSYSVSSEGMADDVRAWLGDPATNFGWILIGDESVSTTTKRFDSRENGTSDNRPQLTITYTTGVAAERPDVPSMLRLAGNYPNPFATSTTIHYEVERAQTVSMKLYDVLGREVRELVRGYQAAGPHEVAVDSDGLPAGTYLYCFDGGKCGRMALLP